MERLHKWPVFICYRRVDGATAARRLHDALAGCRATAPDGTELELDPYLDQDMPGVADWRRLHRPYLEKARALIVVCTPGAKLDEGEHDWVHREIDWWIESRNEAPILVDPLMEGIRFVPAQIVERWPDIQRIPLVESEWAKLGGAALEAKTEALRRQVLGAILPSGAAIYEEELERERARVVELKRTRDVKSRLLVVAIGLLVIAAVAGVAAVLSAEEATRNAAIGDARRADAEAGRQFQSLRELVARRTIKLEQRFDLEQELVAAKGGPGPGPGPEPEPAGAQPSEERTAVGDETDTKTSSAAVEPAPEAAAEAETPLLPEQSVFRVTNLKSEVETLDGDIDRLTNQAAAARARGEKLLAEADAKWKEIDSSGWKSATPRTRSMPPIVFSVEVLSAGEGEILLVRYGQLEAPTLMLINTGLPQRYPTTLGARLRDLRNRVYRGKPVPLELIVIGDQDVQKSGGLLKLLEEVAQPGTGVPLAKIGMIWANIFRFHGGREGQTTLRNRLRERIDTSNIPFNQPFGKFVFRPSNGGIGHRFSGDMKVMVIGPTRHELKDLYEQTGDVARRFEATPEPFIAKEPAALAPLFRLGAQPMPEPVRPRCKPSAHARDRAGGTYSDRSAPNLASTVLLFEFAGMTFLHTADGRGDLILAGLKASGLLDAQGRAYVDLLSVPHAGSSHNISPAFFRQVRARNYLITGDGQFNNPKAETLGSLVAARQCEKFRIFMTTRTHRGRVPPGREPPETIDAFFAAERSYHPNYDLEFLSKGRDSIVVDLTETQR